MIPLVEYIGGEGMLLMICSILWNASAVVAALVLGTFVLCRDGLGGIKEGKYYQY